MIRERHVRDEYRYLGQLVDSFVARDRSAAGLRERDPAGDHRQKPPPPPALDWALVLRLLRDHKVLGALQSVLDTRHLDETEAANLRSATDDFGRRTTLLLLELERILPALEQAGCRPVVLKGAALASDVYAEPAQRYFLDLDILVAGDTVAVACETLAQYGYQLRQHGNDPRFYQKHHFHWIMHNRHGSCVEVHWAVTMPESIFGFELDGLWRRAEPAALSRGTMRVPAAADQILHAVLQCIADGFSDLRRILDTALLLPRVTDFPALTAQAERQRLGVGLWLLLTVTASLAGVEIPAARLQRVQPSPWRRRCLEAIRVPECCLERRAARQSEFVFLIHCLCVPRTGLLWRELHRFLFPGEGPLLEMGFRSDRLPSWRQRAVISLRRLWTLARLGVFLFGRLSGKHVA